MRNRPKKDFRKETKGKSNDRPFKKPFKKDDRTDKPFKKDHKKADERKNTSYDPFKKKHFEKRDDVPVYKKDLDNDKPKKEDKPVNKKPFDKNDDRRDKPFKKAAFQKNDRSNKPFKGKFEKRDDKSDSKDFRGKENKDFKHDNKHYRPYKKKLFKKDATSIQPEPNLDGKTRLNKYIANAGMCSRREADDYIVSGVVKVNGVVITELGFRINPVDLVQFDGQRLTTERKVYLLLNKPKDYITTADDPEGRKTVLDLLKGACKERVYPVGRLDRNTSGLLILTNDGDLTKKLTHPKFGIKKIYNVTLDKNIKQEDLDKLVEGLELEDGKSHFDTIYYLGQAFAKNQLVVELHSGKNRIIRRMFEHLGYEVAGLDRTSFAGLTKKDLPRGKWRNLSEKEVGMLKMIS